MSKKFVILATNHRHKPSELIQDSIKRKATMSFVVNSLQLNFIFRLFTKIY
jgi:hypothetical protein